MPEYRLGHDLDDDPVLRAGHVLDEPLEFENGEAIVEGKETARAIARRHTHIHVAGAVPEETGDDSDESEDEEFDADEFVDRTPMSDVVEDIETGDYDDYLGAIEDAADREGVQDAIDDRREG